MMSETLAEALPREIARVSEIKAHFEELIGVPGVVVAPQIAMMSSDIEDAIKASAEGDTVGMVRAVAKLREWDE